MLLDEPKFFLLLAGIPLRTYFTYFDAFRWNSEIRISHSVLPCRTRREMHCFMNIIPPTCALRNHDKVRRPPPTERSRTDGAMRKTRSRSGDEIGMLSGCTTCFDAPGIAMRRAERACSRIYYIHGRTDVMLARTLHASVCNIVGALAVQADAKLCSTACGVGAPPSHGLKVAVRRPGECIRLLPARAQTQNRHSHRRSPCEELWLEVSPPGDDGGSFATWRWSTSSLKSRQADTAPRR